MSFYVTVVVHTLVYCAIFTAGLVVGIRHERHRRIVHRRRVGRT